MKGAVDSRDAGSGVDRLSETVEFNLIQYILRKEIVKSSLGRKPQKITVYGSKVKASDRKFKEIGESVEKWSIYLNSKIMGICYVAFN